MYVLVRIIIILITYEICYNASFNFYKLYSYKCGWSFIHLRVHAE